MKKNQMKNQRGITLISLVLIIVILIIISGISIAMLTKDNGIIDEAENAQIQSSIAQLMEASEIYVKANQTKQASKTLKRMQTTEQELKDGNIVTSLETSEGFQVGVYSDLKKLEFSSDYGKGGTNIKEGETKKLVELEDCYVLDYTTGDTYYIVDGRIWTSKGETNIKEITSKNEEYKTEEPTETPSETPSTTPSTDATDGNI